MDIQINFVAILVCVVVQFIIGFLWYTPLFGKAWAKEMGFPADMKPEPGSMARGMIAMVIGNFFLAWVLAHNMAAWDFVPGIKEMPAPGNGIQAAVFTWLGFFLPVDIGTVTWEQKSWKLFGINTGYHLVGLLAVALILAHWK